MPLWKVIAIVLGSIVFVGIAGVTVYLKEKQNPDLSFKGAKGGEWTLEPYSIEGSSVAGTSQAELTAVLTKGSIHLTTTGNDLPKGSETLTWGIQGGVGDEMILSGTMNALVEIDGKVEGNNLRFIPSARGLGCDVKMNAGDVKAGYDCASMISDQKTTYDGVVIEIKDGAEATSTLHPATTWTNVWHWRLRKLNDIDTGPSAKKGETNCPQAIADPKTELNQLLTNSIDTGESVEQTLAKMKTLTSDNFFKNELVSYKGGCYEVYGAYFEILTTVGGVEDGVSGTLEKRDNNKEKYYVTEEVNKTVNKNGQDVSYHYKGTILIYLTKL